MSSNIIEIKYPEQININAWIKTDEEYKLNEIILKNKIETSEELFIYDEDKTIVFDFGE